MAHLNSCHIWEPRFIEVAFIQELFYDQTVYLFGTFLLSHYKNIGLSAEGLTFISISNSILYMCNSILYTLTLDVSFDVCMHTYSC